MRDRTASRVAWTIFGAELVLFLAGLAFAFLNATTGTLGAWDAALGPALLNAALFTFPTVGLVVATRYPRNTIGWILLAIGVWPAGLCADGYAVYGLVTNPGAVPQPELVYALTAWMWVPGIVLMGAFLLLLFPDGKLPSPRWRPVLWISVIALVLPSLLMLVAPGNLQITDRVDVRNPLGLHSLKPVLDPLLICVALVPISVIASAASLVQRFRRARGAERLQLKWIAAAAALVAVLYALMMLMSAITGRGWGMEETPFWLDFIQTLSIFSFALIPVSAGIAILKYRLYDIDVVINKTLVFGGLAAFITAVYVAIVVGIGKLIGQGEEPNLGLSIAATAVVAVAFQPVRERVQHFANRLVYGKRATPYEVLSEFSDRVAETYATEDVLPRMAKTVAEGTGAAHAEVWLRSGDALRRAAAWPDDESARESLAMSNGSVPDVPGVDRVIEVRHQGELLGALTVTKPAGEPLTPAEDKLLSDLAGQAGLVLRNVGLTSELLARLEELKASRQRLVAAQDEERRRLERNLHDGAQRHLVALKMKLNLAKRLAKENDKLEAMLTQLSADADEALETLRDLARGIYPPLLADQGLKAALESQARKASVPVIVEADGLSRYPQEVEAAVYFCVLEALQNVAKYANASEAWVRVMEEEGALVFEVRDDGAGFDPATTPKGAGTTNMSDRLESLGGRLEITSAAGAGTKIAGRLPVPAREPVG